MATHPGQNLVCVLLTAVALGYTSGASEESPVVVTKYGMLEGRKVSVKGTAKPVYDYLGIPFAKPPIGALRFAAPQAAEAWTGIREATSQPPGCLQDETALEALKKLITFDFASNNSSEDCLYLNVHTPVAPKDKNKRLPVMVWIHGGGFLIGSASVYDGSPLAAYEDVVVVVIQYRLGILGFISTGDEHLPGNWGMLDQVAALKWVQENIENFGGDPGLVTIFGESAGGMSVSYHLVSPLSSGLFHRAISESGTAFIKIGIQPDPKSAAQIIANATGCDTSDSQEIADCLKKLSEEELSNIVKPPEVILSVVVDGAFLHREVEQLVEAKEISSVPYLLGITNQECGWLLAKLLSPPGWEEGMDRETVESVVKNMSLINKDFLKMTLDEYLGDTQDKGRIRDLYLELFGDVIMLMPTIKFARLHRDAGNSVFLYEFQHRPSVYGNSRPDFVKSDHGDDIGFVFGAPFWTNDVKLLANVTEEELALSRTVMSYWANFAKKGNPNGEGLVLWPLYDHDEGYMQLDLKQQAGSKLKEHRVKFHLELQKQERKKSEQNVKAAGHQRSDL